MLLGMTETGGIVTMQQPHHKNGSCGVLTENAQMKIVDLESGKVLGLNQSGEIWMKIPSLMSGYYRNPEATKNIIDDEGKDIFFCQNNYYLELLLTTCNVLKQFTIYLKSYYYVNFVFYIKFKRLYLIISLSNYIKINSWNICRMATFG